MQTLDYPTAMAQALGSVRAHLLSSTSRADIPFTDPRSASEDVQRWKEQRRLGLGGTDLAVVCGLSPYNDPHSLWLEKRGEREPEPPDVSPERLGWGHFLEEPIALEFSRRTGLAISDPGESLFRAPAPFSWLQGSPDRLIVDADGTTIGVLEIKTSRDVWHFVPAYYLVQVLSYAICLNLKPTDHVYIAAFHMADAELSVWHIDLQRCLPAITLLADLGAAFWRHVEDGTPPCLPPGQAGFSDSAVVLPPADDGTNHLEQYNAKNKLKNLLEHELEALRAQLLVALGDSRYATSGDYEAILSPRSSTRLDGKRLSADHPDLAAQYTTASSSVTLRVQPITAGKKKKSKRAAAALPASSDDCPDGI